MKFLGKIAKFSAILVAVLSVLFYVNVDVRHTLCFLGGLGYLDFLGSGFLDSLTKCMAETSTYYLKRDFQPGAGKLINVTTIDCTKDFSFEKLANATDDFTQPAICKGLLANNKCREWTIDYFREESKVNDSFRVQFMDFVEGNRRAFMRHTYPQENLDALEAYDRLEKGEQIYISFDNYFAINHPKFVDDMNLKQYFPNTKWYLHTLFISNFVESTLGSPFHAAPNDNFFFQCVGRKHWYFVDPYHLKYTSAYVSNGVTLVSNHIDEKLIVDRIPIYEGIVEEGDVLYNPPFWLHAVGTVPGWTVSVANRAWERLIPQKNNQFFDAMYKIGFPAFLTSVVWQKLINRFQRITSLTLQNDFNVKVLNGGALPVLKSRK